MWQLEERRAVPLQVLAVSGQPLVVSVTLPRFPFAKTGSPFATGGPRVRILLPPGASQLRTIRLPEIELITGSHPATPMEVPLAVD